jgi:hypothetical protein
MSSPLPGPLPPNVNDDRGQAAVAIYWTQAAVATIVVALRFYARILIRSLGADDWLMFATLVRGPSSFLGLLSGRTTNQTSTANFSRPLYLGNIPIQPWRLQAHLRCNAGQSSRSWQSQLRDASLGSLLLRDRQSSRRVPDPTGHGEPVRVAEMDDLGGDRSHLCAQLGEHHFDLRAMRSTARAVGEECQGKMLGSKGPD